MEEIEMFDVFIHHRHTNRALAGMVYTYLREKGLNPFLDGPSMKQGTWSNMIDNTIKDAPFFLSVLTEGALDNMENAHNTTYFQELKSALDSGKDILLVASHDFKYPDSDLPLAIRGVKSGEYYRLTNNLSNFYEVMDRLLKDIQGKGAYRKLQERDWHRYSGVSENAFVLSRGDMEKQLATLDNRFGREFVEHVKKQKKLPLEKQKPFNGTVRVKSIRMSCYSAQLIYNPSPDSIDEDRFKDDLGDMFHIFRHLLWCDCGIELIINTPSSPAVGDAIRFNKLGNNALTGERQELIFLNPLIAIQELVETDAVYNSAARRNRFKLLATDCIMPCSIFQITYKDPWEKYNHIKCELYSADISSTKHRRCMLFFQDSDVSNYDFFRNQYNSIRKVAKPAIDLVRQHPEWKERRDELIRNGLY